MTVTEAATRLRAAFGDPTDASPPVFAGPLRLLTLRRAGAMPNRISVAKRLRAAGVTLRECHAVVNELAEVGAAPVRIAEAVDLAALAADLAALDVRVDG